MDEAYYGAWRTWCATRARPIGISLTLVSRLNPRDIKGADGGPQRARGDPQAGQKFVKGARPAETLKFASMADYYEILGVGRSATAAEIRQAYAQLAREKHPDRFQDAEEKEQAQRLLPGPHHGLQHALEPEEPPGVRPGPRQAAA